MKDCPQVIIFVVSVCFFFFFFFFFFVLFVCIFFFFFFFFFCFVCFFCFFVFFYRVLKFSVGHKDTDGSGVFSFLILFALKKTGDAFYMRN